MAKKAPFWSMSLAGVLVMVAAGHAAAPYYEGKTLRLLVAFAPGGGFDTYTRAIGRHLGKNLPGKPTIIVENMTGAGGIVQANYMFKQAKPDGLTIGNNIGGLFLQQVMGAKGIEFDGRKFEYIGAPAVDHPVCALTKASGMSSLEKWLASKDPVRLGGVGPGGTASDVPRILQAALNLPIRVVEPYKGTAEIKLAAESGELAGGCWAWESMKAMWRKGIESGEVAIVVLAMPKKLEEIPNVPLAVDFAKTSESRQLLKYGIHDISMITRPYFFPPGTSKELVKLLRKAFMDTLKDTEFLAEARKGNLDIEPVTGEEIEAVVNGLFKLEPDWVAKLKSVLVPH
ncbi:MAG TPA: tripartite tricarboxylate transporter substrate-binding protein [Candidatus Binatia bacterium]|jgi:tripartite-type tricarboxylate transporter receptor subunit TctC|nr:tripartite tricarboxylate transporter substrate-binding protein [Candidatus Binatia bacterium]